MTLRTPQNTPPCMVLIDGEPWTHVLRANVEEGWAEVCNLENGKPYCKPGTHELATSIIRGKVELIPK